jgi:hypothetical protein
LEGLENEALVQAIWRINSLRRSLAIMALTWASCLHDPSNFVSRQPVPGHKDLGKVASGNSLVSAPVRVCPRDCTSAHVFLHRRVCFCVWLLERPALRSVPMRDWLLHCCCENNWATLSLLSVTLAWARHSQQVSTEKRTAAGCLEEHADIVMVPT